MSTPIPASIALVDFFHMLTVNFKAYAAAPTDDARPNAAGFRTLEQLAAVRSSCEHVVVCMDSPPYWRKELYPEYKGKRAEREPEWKAVVDWTLERVRLEGYNIAQATKEEADDVAATLARKYSEEYGCKDVRIVGADKDALQCVSDKVRCFVPKERGEFDIRGPEWLMKELAVTPADFPLLLAIMGDTSDNIPGIKGLGKGHGANLIKLYKNPEGMALGLVAAQNDATLNEKPISAVWKNYAAGMANLPLWLKLTTLNTDAKLELHPLEYLEKLTPQSWVDDGMSEVVDLGEIGGDGGPTAEELEEERAMMEAERAAMAAELPVGRTLVTEPMPDPAVRRAQNAADADRILPMPPMHDPAQMVVGKDPKAAAVLAELAAQQASVKAGSPSISTAQSHSGPSAPAPTASASRPATAPSAAGAASPPPAATQPAPAASSSTGAQVVSSRQGPPKPKPSDAIDAPDALVKVDPPRWELAAQPTTAKEMLQIAAVTFNTPMFKQFGTANGNFAVMAYGRELGLGFMQSLMAFCQVKERPFMWAHAMRGIILAHPDCAFFVNTECTAEASTWVTRRKSWPADVPTARYQFTYAEAIEIGLTAGPNALNWKTNKRSMVDKTASARLARQVWADVIGGLHTPEEEK